MYPHSFIRLDENHLRDFIAKRKEIQYNAALPYMREPARLDESEPELRQRVRDALEYLSDEEVRDMNLKIRKARRDAQRRQTEEK